MSSAACWRGLERQPDSCCLLSVTDMLTTQADRFSPEEVRAQPGTVTGVCVHRWIFLIRSLSTQMEQMFAAFPPDVSGNLDYKNLVYIITHGEEKDQE